MAENVANLLRLLTAGSGPTLPTLAVRQVVGYPGYSGRDANVHTKAARVKGFGCRPLTDEAASTEAGAGVRKPPRKETAGSGTGSCSVRYGELSTTEVAGDGNRGH